VRNESMRRDDLRQPLRRRSFGEKVWAKRPSLLALAYALATCGFASAGYWAVTTPNPFAGEPVVMAVVPPVEEIVTASTAPAPEAAPEAPDETVASAEEQREEAPPDPSKPKYVIEQPVEAQIYKQEAALVISARKALAKAPVAAVSESTAAGVLPRVADNGKKPSAVYARPVSMNVTHSDSPKIAIILGGMGLSEGLTKRATSELPPDVTLAFAPYGQDLQRQVDRARKDGHEVLLQIPMEPVGYPASNPGPKTLLADAGKAENIEALHWHMSRFAGYTGLINYMGGRLLANPAALKPLMAETKSRGLLFIEDGTMPLTAAAGVAKQEGLQTRRAHLVIDADPTPEAIEAALALLEAEAQTNGIAIGTGSGLGVTIETVKTWVKAAAERGIILIPASAAFKGRQS
jgi:uncharacterized protein